MKKTLAPPDSLQHEYDRLRKSLARTGYISQGSVLDRSTLRPPRSGYQWTRKVAGKTITVALSGQQFEAFSRKTNATFGKRSRKWRRPPAESSLKAGLTPADANA